jgi:hypothetical protein
MVMTANSDLEWVINFPHYREDATDPSFYCDGDGHTFLGNVIEKNSGWNIGVYCNGEMRVRGDSFGANHWVRYSSNLIKYGINTDEKLKSIPIDDWNMNPWFDLYLINIDESHLDFPHFNIMTEGIPQAKRIITNLQNAYGKYDSNRDYAIAEIYDELSRKIDVE